MGEITDFVRNLWSPNEVKTNILRSNFKELLMADQLLQQKKLEKVFNGYTEGKINFLPTFKYNPGTSDWDTSEKVA